MASDSASAIGIAHVEVRELRDAGAEVGLHDSNPDQSLVRERDESSPSGCQIPLALSALGSNGVLALAVRQPRRGTEVAVTLLELRPPLHVHRLNALGPINLSEPLEVGRNELPVGDLTGDHVLLCERFVDHDLIDLGSADAPACPSSGDIALRASSARRT